ncbi:MAG: hypothetical protein Q9160_007624 [Pyrenula sp. 1 TL-2023]
MMLSPFALYIYFVVIAPFVCAQSKYYELLTLKPLPLGTILASFDFRSNQSYESFQNQDFSLFPRSLGQILQHANARELHIRFTTGRWDPETWGSRPWNGYKEGGTGVELWAWIEAASEEAAYADWITLTQSLSGLFCASLNFVDSTRTTRPTSTFGQTGHHVKKDTPLHMLHGVLPGEVVCTENLTPFLKLLPCKGKAGISSLLDGHKLFDASWQSMSIDVRPICEPGKTICNIEISHSVDMVLDIERSKRPRDNPIPRPIPADQLICDTSKPYHSHDTCFPVGINSDPSWSLNDIFGTNIAGSCPLADESHQPVRLIVPHDRLTFLSPGIFESKSPPGEIPESRRYHIHPSQGFDIELPAKSPSNTPHFVPEPIQVERTITGHGAANGGLRTVFRNPASNPITFVYFETLPWFMRPFLHTLRISLSSSQPSSTSSSFDTNSSSPIKSITYRPAIDRLRSTQLELQIAIPPSSTTTMTYDFEKAVLRYTEYPPDANRGFNVAPAVLRIITASDPTNAASSEESTYLRTTSLLLPLPTPDFSMPYNVIILTSTVIALAFGNVFNLLVRRFVGTDEVEGWDLKGAVRRVREILVEKVGKLIGKKGDGEEPEEKGEVLRGDERSIKGEAGRETDGVVEKPKS